MSAKGGTGKEPTSEPKSFPQTTPTVGSGDVGAWVLTAINKMEGTLGRIEATVIALDKKVDGLGDDTKSMRDTVSGHEKWVHTLKVLCWAIGIIGGWVVVNVVGPWVVAKLKG